MSKNIGLAEVRLRAAKRLPHFRRYVLSLVPVERPGLGSICVDKHGRVYYDPEWLLSRPIDESSFALLHETYHLLQRYWERSEKLLGPAGFQQRSTMANMAADLATNDVLQASGIEVGKDYLLPKRMSPPMKEGLIFEEYFQELLDRQPKEPPPQPKPEPSQDQSGEGDGQEGPQKSAGSDGEQDGPDGQPDADDAQGEAQGDARSGGNDQDGKPQDQDGQPGDGGDGVPYDGPPPDRRKGEGGSCSDGQRKPWEEPAPSECGTPGLDEVDKKLLERQVAQEIEAAAKGRGNVPGALRRWAEGILRPKADPVRELLAKCRFALACVPGYGDFTYKRPPRRRPAGCAILPAHVQPAPEVLVLCDTSGSMGSRDFALAFGLVEKVVRGLPHGKVRFASGDTHLAVVKRLVKLADVELVGGGGTDVGAMIEEAAKQRPRPKVIVALTDGWTPWPAKPIPGLNVVACLTQEPRYYPVPKWIQKVVLKPQEDN